MEPSTFRLLEAITQPVFVISQGAVYWVNSAAASLGIGVGRALYDFLHAENYPIPSKLGSRFNCELRGVPYRALCTAQDGYAVYCLEQAEPEPSAGPERGFPGQTLAHTSAAIRRAVHEMRTSMSELYTPLTQDENADVLRSASVLLRGVYRLERVADNLDSLQKLRSDDFAPLFETLDLTQLFCALLSKAEELLRYSDLKLEYDVSPGIKGDSDRRLLSLIFWNLLSNAALDCEGAELRCTVRRRDGVLELCVENRSASPLFELVDLHERHTVRMEDSLTQPGVGMGVSLVRGAAERLGGALVYTQAKDRTVRALVSVNIEPRAELLRSGVLIPERGVDEGLVGLSDVLRVSAFDIRDLL